MRRNIMRLKSKWISILLAIIFIILNFPANVFAENGNSDPVIVVSMGDSYSSGEGIEPFYGQEKSAIEKAKDNNWLAHRSQKSWPSLLKIPGMENNKTICNYNVETTSESAEYEWYFVAASGAETKHINKEEQKKDYWLASFPMDIKDYKYLPKQLDVFNDIKGKVDYVTLTIGGNDVGFTDIITSCALGSTYLNLSSLDAKFNKLWREFDTTKNNIKQVYTDIQDAAGPQANVIVAGYPKLLDKNGNGNLISKEEANTVNNNVSKFNDEIYKIVMECDLAAAASEENELASIHFVDVEDEFDKDGGHQAYSKNPWINEIMFGPRAEELDYARTVASAYSMHPNEEGAKHYADCVNAKIEEIENENETFKFNGHYYKFYNNSLTWEVAKKFCEGQGGHLVTITSEEEQRFLQENCAGIKNLYWIGLQKANDEWGWITGEELSYANWATGEPNEDFNDTEFYAQMYGTDYNGYQLGEWNDSRIASGTMDFYQLENVGFICEWDNNPESIFTSMPSDFTFSSGAGGWSTQFTLEDDGSFTGQYYASDMGDIGAEYPSGTVYISKFTGKFTTPTKINDYTYSMRLENLQTEGTTGEEYFENGQRFIYADPYGFDNADEFLIYTPDAPMSELPEVFKSWLVAWMNPNEEQILPCYGIYNVGGEEGFVGYEDTSSENESSNNSNVTQETLVGNWLQADSNDPMMLTLGNDGSIQYYATVSNENEYTSTFSWDGTLWLNLVRIDNYSTISVPYQVSLNQEGNSIQMTLSMDKDKSNEDFTPLYGMESLLEGTYQKVTQ